MGDCLSKCFIRKGSAIQNSIMILNFWWTYVLLWGHSYPCFELLVTSALGFKASVDFSLACFLACMLFLRFTSGVTPANLLTASTAGHQSLHTLIMLYSNMASGYFADPEWLSGLQCRTCGTDGHRFEPQTSTNACRHVCNYVDQKGSAAMLTSIQSAGAAPEVNLRNSLHAGDKAHKRGIHPGFETQGRHTRSPNRGNSGPMKRTYVLQKFQKKKKK